MIYLAILILLLSLAIAYKAPTEWYPYGLALLSFIVIFGKIFLSLGKKVFDYLLNKFNIKYKTDNLEITEKDESKKNGKRL